MSKSSRWALRLLARLHVAVGFSAVANLDTTIGNVSPPKPLRRSRIILFKIAGISKHKN
jgi:hypothetical protein